MPVVQSFAVCEQWQGTPRISVCITQFRVKTEVSLFGSIYQFCTIARALPSEASMGCAHVSEHSQAVKQEVLEGEKGAPLLKRKYSSVKAPPLPILNQ